MHCNALLERETGSIHHRIEGFDGGVPGASDEFKRLVSLARYLQQSNGWMTTITVAGDLFTVHGWTKIKSWTSWGGVQQSNLSYEAMAALLRSVGSVVHDIWPGPSYRATGPVCFHYSSAARVAQQMIPCPIENQLARWTPLDLPEGTDLLPFQKMTVMAMDQLEEEGRHPWQDVAEQAMVWNPDMTEPRQLPATHPFGVTALWTSKHSCFLTPSRLLHAPLCKGGLLLQDVGMGKTVQSIALCMKRGWRRSGLGPTLVVCPPSLCAQWKMAIEYWDPSARVVTYPSAGRWCERTHGAADAVILTPSIVRSEATNAVRKSQVKLNGQPVPLSIYRASLPLTRNAALPWLVTRHRRSLLTSPLLYQMHDDFQQDVASLWIATAGSKYRCTFGPCGGSVLSFEEIAALEGDVFGFNTATLPVWNTLSASNFWKLAQLNFRWVSNPDMTLQFNLTMDILRESGTMFSTHFSRIVVDEAHASLTRSTTSKTFSAFLGLQCSSRWLLTATPPSSPSLMLAFGQFFHGPTVSPFQAWNDWRNTPHQTLMQPLTIKLDKQMNYSDRRPIMPSYTPTVRVTPCDTTLDRIAWTQEQKDAIQTIVHGDHSFHKHALWRLLQRAAPLCVPMDGGRVALRDEDSLALSNIATISQHPRPLAGASRAAAQAEQTYESITNTVRSTDVFTDGTCPVCIGDMEQGVSCPCKHAFCFGCIKQWFSTSRHIVPKCPMCRGNGTPLARLVEPALTEQQDEGQLQEDVVTTEVAEDRDISLVSAEESQGFEASPKLQVLIDLVASCRAAGDKCVVITQYKQALAVVKEHIPHVCVLQSGLSPIQRARVLESFKKDQSVTCFAGTSRSIGTGLDLVQANHVIFFECPEIARAVHQGIGRICRLGQQKNTHVHFLADRVVEATRATAAARGVQGQPRGVWDIQEALRTALDHV